MQFLAEWPQWVSRAVITLVIVGAAYAIGHLVRVLLGARLSRLASRLRGDWDDRLVSEITRRVPFWAILIGAYFTLPFWSLTDHRYAQAVKVLSAFAVASVTLAVAAVATRLVSSFGRRTASAAPVSALTQNVVTAVVTVLGGLAIVKLLFGVDITPYLTALGVGGLAVALAVQDPLSNFFAGVFLSVSGQIRIGDYVRLDSGAEGHVADFNWRATTIRAPSNNYIIVPNAKLAQAIVTNFDQPSADLSFSVDVGVHYLSDLSQVERVAIDVARTVMREVPGGVVAFQPFARFHTFGPMTITLSVGLRAQAFTDQPLLRHELLKRLHERFAAERIVLPYAGSAADSKAIAAAEAEGQQV